MQMTVNNKLEKKPTRRGVILKALRAIEEQKGMLTPHDIVEVAKNPESELHDSFNWDDSRAGHLYRLMQARMLIADIRVEFLGEERSAYYNATVQIKNVPVRGYFPIERVYSEEDIRKDVLRQAIRELTYFQNKYKSLKELEGVFDTERLSKIQKEVEKK